MTRAADQPRSAVPLVGRPAKRPSGGPTALVEYANWLHDLMHEHARLTNAAVAKTIPSKTSSTGYASGTTVSDALRGQAPPRAHIVEAIITLRLQDDEHRSREEEIRRKNKLLRHLAEQACMPATNRSAARILQTTDQLRRPRHATTIPAPAASAGPGARRAPMGDQRKLAEATGQITALEAELDKQRRITNDAREDRDRANNLVHSLRLENATLRAGREQNDGAEPQKEDTDEVARQLDEARDEARRLRTQAQEELDQARSVRRAAEASAKTLMEHAQQKASELQSEINQLVTLRHALRKELANLTATVEASMTTIGEEPNAHQESAKQAALDIQPIERSVARDTNRAPYETYGIDDPYAVRSDDIDAYSSDSYYREYEPKYYEQGEYRGGRDYGEYGYGSDPYPTDGYSSSPYESEYGAYSHESGYDGSPYGSGRNTSPYEITTTELEQSGPYLSSTGQWQTRDPATGRVVRLVPETVNEDQKQPSGSGRHRRK